MAILLNGFFVRSRNIRIPDSLWIHSWWRARRLLRWGRRIIPIVDRSGAGLVLVKRDIYDTFLPTGHRHGVTWHNSEQTLNALHRLMALAGTTIPPTPLPSWDYPTGNPTVSAGPPNITRKNPFTNRSPHSTI